jgi:toxin HigB-1
MKTVIKSFRHKGIERFFLTGKTSGIQAAHANKLRRQLAALNEVTTPDAINIPGWRLHALKGQMAGLWFLSVNANWRLNFAFEGGDVILVDYLDYH